MSSPFVFLAHYGNHSVQNLLVDHYKIHRLVVANITQYSLFIAILTTFSFEKLVTETSMKMLKNALNHGSSFYVTWKVCKTVFLFSIFHISFFFVSFSCFFFFLKFTELVQILQSFNKVFLEKKFSVNCSCLVDIKTLP